MSELPNGESIRSLMEYGEGQRENKGLLMCVAYWSIVPEAITAVIDAGADVNLANDEGQTPLMFAAWHNPLPEVTRRLIQAGADVNARDSKGWTPLLYAADGNQNPNILQELLVRGADIGVEDSEGRSVLDVARSRRDLEDGDLPPDPVSFPPLADLSHAMAHIALSLLAPRARDMGLDVHAVISALERAHRVLHQRTYEDLTIRTAEAVFEACQFDKPQADQLYALFFPDRERLMPPADPV